MKKNLILNSLFGLVIGLLWFVPGTFAAAFGIAPPWIINENLKPGSNFVYVIDLNTNDPSMDMTVKSRITGDPEILDWIKIRNQETLTMPAGQHHVPMHVELSVPKDAKVGKYKGDIGVTVIPKNVENQDVAIYLGGHISVQLEVTNRDITDYWIKSVGVKSITEGQPVTLNLEIKNLGNMPVSSVKTKVEIMDKEGRIVATGSGETLTRHIFPHTVEYAELTVPIKDLLPGNYWVNVIVYKGTQSIYQNKLYMAVNALDLNNVVETSVKVATEEEMRAAAADAMAQELSKPQVFADAKGTGNNVKVKTTVTVRAPLTNQLIGVVIILLGVLIVVTARMQGGLFKKKFKKHTK